MSKYTLVSQGIKLFDTDNFVEAYNYYKRSNEEYYKYREECAENYEPCADNEVFMYEQCDGTEKELSYKEIVSRGKETGLLTV